MVIIFLARDFSLPRLPADHSRDFQVNRVRINETAEFKTGSKGGRCARPDYFSTISLCRRSQTDGAAARRNEKGAAAIIIVMNFHTRSEIALAANRSRQAQICTFSQL
jgi:hypothetical protein